MKKYIICLLLLFIAMPAYALTTTTTGAGDWNTGGNWDNGVPGVDDDAVISHAMTVDGTGATFSTLDNNSTITFTATADVVIKDAGSIDNAGGTISSGNQNVTFKAATGTTKWTWTINSGTWTDGTGEHHFENADIKTTAAYSLLNSGSYHFDEDCSFSGDTNSEYFQFSADAIFAADKTFTISDGSTTFDLRFYKGVTAVGGSGTEITFDGQDKGFLYCVGASGVLAIDFQYCDMVDLTSGIRIQTFDDNSGDSATIENCNISSSVNGFYITSIDAGATLTISDCSTYSCTSDGIITTHTTGMLVLNDVDSYSNGLDGIGCAAVGAITTNRCKIYGNTQRGVQGPNNWTNWLANSCLVYENTLDNLYIGTQVAGILTNCTIADAGALYSNIYSLLAAGDVLDIKNCNIYGAKYGVTAGGAVDHVVTYTDCYGASTANYNSMTDPTGSNGNISADPKFTSVATDDYHIGGGMSPCINKGTNTGAPATDLDGDAWLNDNVEMGAYTELMTTYPAIGINVSGSGATVGTVG